MSDSYLSYLGVLIPIVAIVGSLVVQLFTVLAVYKRRKLISEERRAMIEKGMEPPPITEQPLGLGAISASDRRERALRMGIQMLLIGIGLGVGAWLLRSVFAESPRVAGWLALGAVLAVALGLGNLLYAIVSSKLREGGGPAA